VIKSATPAERMVPGWVAPTQRVVPRCLRPSYRLDLMAPGQRCLLWRSGRQEPGVHAIGALSGEVGINGGPVVDVELWLLPSPVPREELLRSPALSAAEVLRMPAGSNPSYLSAKQYAALLGHLDAATLKLAGWA